MRAGRSPLAVALLAVLALLTAAAPAAAAQTYTQKAERMVRFQLKASNGYNFYVQRRQGSRNVSVTIWHDRLPYGVEYATSSPSTAPNRIAARFPGLGRIDVTLRLRGRARRNSPPRGCGGRGNLVQPAVARGTIRFRGERGFTRVSATSALAQVVQRPRRRCGRLGLGTRAPVAFAVEEFSGDLASFFEVEKVRRKGGPKNARFLSSFFRLEEMRKMFVFRWAWGVGGPASFVFADRRAMPENVFVQPPPPFDGKATLARTAESTLSWTGSLSVELPGLAPQRLTGRRFDLRLCLEDRCVSEEGASNEDDLDFFRARPDALRLMKSTAATRISGSQSWNFDPASSWR